MSNDEPADAPRPPENLSDRLSLEALIAGLLDDLKQLRRGQISVRDAHARAELARQILRGVHYVVIAQRYLESRPLPAVEDANHKPRKPGKDIDHD